MSDPDSGCTCWRVPDLRSALQPVGWLMLHDEVVISLTGTDRESPRLRTGRVLGAARDVSVPGVEPYLVLEERPGQFIEIQQSRITFAEPLGCPDPELAADAMGLRDSFLLSLGEPLSKTAPTTARFHQGGREYVEVTIRRGIHTCTPIRESPL